MTWLAWTIAYLGLHFAVYAIFLRQRPAFIREPVIFLYEVSSEIGWLALIAMGALFSWWAAPDLAGWTAIVFLHAIYSLSFLSLWSLASGGYSLGILQFAEARGGLAIPLEREPLEQIGVVKQESRLQAVQDLSLVEDHGGAFRLTGRGRVFAALVAAGAWVYNVRETG